MSFQFHKGSIKTANRNELEEVVSNFNSIKVRLRRLQDDYQLF